MARPNLVDSHPLDLADGRRVRIKEYDDGSVRFQIDLGEGGSYAMTECYLQGRPTDHAIIKLIQPDRQR